MEESIKYLKEQFELQPVDIRTYSPVVLAYIGDAVYELVIRTILVDQGNRQANTLHKRRVLMSRHLHRLPWQKHFFRN